MTTRVIHQQSPLEKTRSATGLGRSASKSSTYRVVSGKLWSLVKPGGSRRERFCPEETQSQPTRHRQLHHAGHCGCGLHLQPARLGARASYSSGLGKRIHVKAVRSLRGCSATHVSIFDQQQRGSFQAVCSWVFPKPSSHGIALSTGFILLVRPS